MKKDEEIRQMYESGILTKEEMEAELKKLPATKAESKVRSKIFAIIGVILPLAVLIAIGGAIYSSHKHHKQIEEAVVAYSNDGDQLREIYLGEFTDLEGFHPVAIQLINKYHNGKITFWVYPSNNFTEIDRIRIKQFKSHFVFYGNDEKSQKAEEENYYVGPFIYSKDKAWAKAEELKKLEPTMGWQPITMFYEISLTPKAVKKLLEIRELIRKGAIMSDGKNWTFTDGSPVAESEKELFNKHIAPAYMEE